MRISSFYIEHFGIFSDLEVTDLPRGMAIFFGQNEAGKSTCMEFLRYMLTGPNKVHNIKDPNNKDDDNIYTPLSGKDAKGVMVLNEMGVHGDVDDLTLVRHSFKKIPFSLSSNGQPVSPEIFTQTFAGITPEVYRSVFGFSLSELEQFENLNDDGVRNALYGASFGSGLESPSEVIKTLKEESEKLFVKGGHVRPLNDAFKKYKEYLSKIGELQAANAEYDKLYDKLEKAEVERLNLGQQKNELGLQLGRLQRQLDAWPQWEEWRSLGQQLEKMAPLRADFPEDARARAARLSEARENHERIVESQRVKLEQLREIRESKVYDEALLVKLPFLQRLAEQKTSYRDARNQITGLQAKYERLADELTQTLNKLGPGWNCHKIHALDRSIFSDQELEKLGTELQEAEAAKRVAIEDLRKRNEEVAEAHKALEEIRAEIAELPEIHAILNDNERIELRENMTLLEKSRREYPARKEAFEKAKADLLNAANQAGIVLPEIVDDKSFTLVQEKISQILASHQDATALAQEVEQCNREAETASNALAQAQKEVEEIKQNLEQAEEDWHAHASPGREALDRRRQALKSLRSLGGSIETEKERLQELEGRINIEKNLKSGANIPLTILAIALIIVGCGIYFFHAWLNLSEVRLGEALAMPLHNGMAYASLVLGVILIAVGHAGSGKDRKRRKIELEQLLSRKETCSMHLAELIAQATEKCKIAQIDSMDPITLDATEMLLEREQEQCMQEEQSRLQIDRLQEKYDKACGLRDEAQALVIEREKAVQAGRRHWHTLMDGLNAGFVPSPENVETFYLRVENCKTAYTNVVNANKELDAVWADLNVREESITNMPAIRATLEAAEEPLSLEEAVNAVLSSCSDAEAVHNKRQQRLGAQENMEKTLNRAREEQEKATNILGDRNSQLQAVSAQWEQAVVRLDLGKNPNPETVRAAFEYMDQSLKIENDLLDTGQELDKARNEMNSLEQPLTELKEQFKLDQDNGDWLEILDILLEKAQKAATIANERKTLESSIEAEETELGSKQAALALAQGNEQALLQQAGVESIEDFLRLDRKQTERRELENQYANVKSALEFAAQKQPLQQFLAELAEEDQESLELKLQKLEQEIADLSEQESQLAENIVKLKVQRESLENATELAKLSQDTAMQLEKLEELGHSWSVYALAVAIMKEAKKTFEKERQPEVIRRASEIFSKITHGKWKGISASLDNNSLSIISAHGEPIMPFKLSRGAQEQAYLSLRIAYIENYAAHAQSLPVIMDEIMVNFDQDRLERTARVLAEMAASPKGQQIFYFTCKQEIVDVLRSAVPHAPIFKMENWQIRRQN